MRRNSRILLFSTIQSLRQLLLFASVFGAVATGGHGTSYKDFVVPAVLVQTMVFAAMGSSVGIATDSTGLAVRRYRRGAATPTARMGDV